MAPRGYFVGQHDADAREREHHDEQDPRRGETGRELASALEPRGQTLVPGADRARDHGGDEEGGRERLDDERQQGQRDDGQDEQGPARRLRMGEPSVAVAVTAPHRGAAFEACRYAIDTLKATVPIWKKEFYADGAVWLEGPGSAPVEVTARAT